MTERLTRAALRRKQEMLERTEHLARIGAARAFDYQDEAYAARYRTLVERVRKTESERARGRTELSEAVARYYFKLLAYKDEYEVARLYAEGDFQKRLRERFEPGGRIRLHLAPPLWSKRDPRTGHPEKRPYGPWVLTAFKYLAAMKRLRGTRLDPFGYTRDRRTERQLIADYERVIDELLAGLNPDNHGLAVEIARVPEHIRGFGHVKERHLASARQREAELLARYRGAKASLVAAE